MDSFFTGSSDDSGKSVPKPRKSYFYPHAEIPGVGDSGSNTTRGSRPASVYVVDDNSGDIFFKFHKDGDYINFGGNMQGTNGQLLEISPIAWSGSNGSCAAGDVIFYYLGER